MKKYAFLLLLSAVAYGAEDLQHLEKKILKVLQNSEQLSTLLKEVHGKAMQEDPKNFEQRVLDVLRNSEQLPLILMEAQGKAMQKRQMEEEQKLMQNINQVLLEEPEILTKVETPVLKGTAERKKHIIVFISPYCPHCKAVVQDFMQLIKQHPDYHVSLYLSTNEGEQASPLAARALLAAAKMGKFEELFLKLVERINLLEKEDWIRLAQSIGLDPQAFEQWMNSEEIQEQLKAMVNVRNRFGFMGMPSIIYQRSETNKPSYGVVVGRPPSLEQLARELLK